MATRLNRTFTNMKTRCYNPDCENYKDYGGRGIRICDEWYTPHSHKGWIAFKDWALSNGYADDLTIDRIDNNKGYSPGNCRWVSMKTQCNNTRHNRLITYKGKTQTMVQWSEELNLGYETIVYRLHVAHWTVEKTFETPGNADYKLLTYNGKTQSLAEWCRELNLTYHTIKCRLNRYHWSVEKAFSERGDGRKTKKPKTQEGK